MFEIRTALVCVEISYKVEVEANVEVEVGVEVEIRKKI